MAAVNPQLTLSDLYPDNVAFSGFAPESASRWVSTDLQARLALSGGPLTVRGSMPMLCSAGSVAGAAVLADLVSDVLAVSTDGVLSFASEAEYSAGLRRLAGSNTTVVTQHRHPASLLPPDRSWIPPDVQGTLNDKGNLEKLVPSHGCPRRQVGDPRDRIWTRELQEASFPLMLKAATTASTGGGALDVIPCLTVSDLSRGLAALADSERVVAEEWIDTRARHLCVNAAVLPNGEAVLVGSAEVISSNEGVYLGNWLGDADAQTSTQDLVLDIARAGAALGYRGLLGIDVAELPDGSTLAYDLNFRLCGSTTPLLVAPAVMGPARAKVARMRPWLLDMPLAESARALERARDLGLTPLGLFDPSAHGLQGPIRVSTLVMGESRSHVDERICELDTLLS